MFALLLVLSLNSAFSLEAEISYKKHDSRSREFQPYGSSSLPKKLEKPEGDIKIPELNSEKPIFSEIQLGDTKRIIIVDMQKKNNPFYNRLYYDANENLDLTDDKVLDAVAPQNMNRNYVNLEFLDIDATYKVDGKTLPYSFAVRVYCFFSSPSKKELTDQVIQQNLNLNIRTKCSYNGKIKYKNNTYNFNLNDRNANGLFSDTANLNNPNFPPGYHRPLYSGGDKIYIKDGEKLNYNDEIKKKKKMMLAGDLFNLSVSIVEGKLSLEPYDGKLHPVKLPMDPERIAFIAKDNQDSICIYKSGSDFRLPGGEYKFYAYTILEKDKMGDEWFLKAGATEDTSWYKIGESDETVNITMGEPYVPFVDVPQWSRQNLGRGTRQVNLNFNIRGAGQELISDFRRMSGTKTTTEMSSRYSYRPAEPKFTIAKADGSIVAKGNFEYG